MTVDNLNIILVKNNYIKLSNQELFLSKEFTVLEDDLLKKYFFFFNKSIKIS